MDFTSSNVASIFKILVGTMLAIVLSSLIVEFFNVTLTSTFVRGTVTKSIEKSCDFFAQETYVRDKDSTTDLKVYNVVSPIYFSDGTEAVSSNFFEGSTQKQIYEKLYKSRDFKEFAEENGKYWLNLRRLGHGLWGSSYRLSGASLSAFDKTAGKQYANSYVTALNSGITYLDKQALEKIARWNMVSNFYGGNPDTLYREPANPKRKGAVHISGTSDEMDDFVMYDGYKIYYNTLNIKDITYKVYDLTNKNQAKEFAKRTCVGWDSVAGDVDMDYWKNTVGLDSSDERRYVCVADIDYEMVLTYDGITPIKRIFSFFINQSNAMNQRASQVQGATHGVPGVVQGYNNVRWDDSVDGYTAGSFGSDFHGSDFYYLRHSDEGLASTRDYSLLNFNGKVTYYIIR